MLILNAGEAFHILHCKIRKALYNLNFEIRETGHDLPLARFVREGVHTLNVQVGKGVNNLHLEIRKGIHPLNATKDPRGFGFFAG